MNIKEVKVSVIIPNYNGEKLLERSLPKITKASNISENHILEIIVVDDFSNDASCQFIKENYKSVKLIRHRANRGFSSAVNTGVRSSKGNIVCLLNSDVIPNEDVLEDLLPNFKNDNVFAVSMHEKGYSWSKGVFENGFMVHKPGRERKVACSTFWVSGGSGCFRKDYWTRLGGFDVKLYSPFYWEDVDLCYRALKRGYALLWEPSSKVVHEHESTTKNIPIKKRSLIQERNQLFFIWKNLTSNNLFKKHIAGLFRRIIRNPGYLVVVIFALTKFRSVKRARKKEKKESRVSDEAIFASFQ